VLQTPHWNFDVVAYAGAARVWLGQAPEQAHAEVYRELALAAPPEAEEAIRSLSEYREGVAGSVDQFRVQIPMYTNKPLYVGLTAALVGLGADSILAPFWVSAASYGGFALLLLLCLRRVTSRWSSWMIGLPLLLSPAFRHVGQEPTPDALSACILLGGLYALAFGGRVLIGAMLLLLSIAARPDNVILCVAIAGWWWWKAPTQRPLAAIGAFASVVAYMVVNRVTGARSRRFTGRTVEVLVDGTSRKNAGELSGRTRCNRVVNFDGQGRVAVGDLAWVRVTEALPHSLRGTLVERPEEAACLSK